MPARPLRAFALLLLSGLLLLAGGSCVGYASGGTLKSSVQAGGATAVSASFQLNHGRVAIRGGASALMQGAYATDDKNDPAVSYAVQGQQGTLSVIQTGTGSHFSMIPVDSSWTVDLNDDIPLDLAVESGGARAILSLDTLTVSHLSLKAGAGVSTISLNGIQRELTRVDLNATSGAVTVQMRGSYQKPRVLDATTISGSLTLDLGRAAGAGLTGTVLSNSGSITIVVPSDAGVEVAAATTSGTIHANGLTEQSAGVFANPADGTTKTMIRLSVRSTSGTITLKLAPPTP